MPSDLTPVDAEVPRRQATTATPHASRRTNLWMLPADRGKYVGDFVTGGYAGVDSPVDLSSVQYHKELRACYEQQHPEKTPSQVGLAVSYLTVILDIQEGDYVITPEHDSEWLRYGPVVGPWYFLKRTGRCPYRNRRSVQWAKSPLSRQRLSQAFQDKLGVGARTTVFSVPYWDEFMEAAQLSSAGPVAHCEESGPGGNSLVRPTTSATHSEAASATRATSSPNHEPQTTRARTAYDEDSVEDGVEVEQEDEGRDKIDHPFDPSRIKVRTITIVVDQLLARVRHREIDLAPDFQRHSDIWKDVNKSRLIESLLLRIPIPVFYVAANEEDHWAVVDGVQRISTITDYVSGKFPLKKLEYREELNGRHFDNLPRSMQRRIGETQLTVNVIEPGTPPEVMFNIFRRINTGGEPLRAQEIRHALHPGPVRNLLKELAESDEFLDATGTSISKKRMADRECALRFLAFFRSWEQYATNSLDSYFNNAMRNLNSLSRDERQTLGLAFRRAMRDASRILGDNAFRKRYRETDRKYPINKPLFEAWSVALARCSENEIGRLVSRRHHVCERFMDLLENDAEFGKAISLSTGTHKSVRKRFSGIEELLQDVLQ